MCIVILTQSSQGLQGNSNVTRIASPPGANGERMSHGTCLPRPGVGLREAFGFAGRNAFMAVVFIHALALRHAVFPR